MPFNVILLTQEKGYFVPNTNQEIGNRSCALIQREHERLGNTLTQFKISDCSIDQKSNEFLYCNKQVDLPRYHGVVLRTWGDGLQKRKALSELLPFLEKHGLYPDNPLSAIVIAENKKLMQQTIEESRAPCPRSLVIEQSHDTRTISAFIQTLKVIFITKSLQPSSFPAYVVKPNLGTHGNGIRMFFLGEEPQLFSYVESLSKTDSCIIQEYIKPAFLVMEKTEGEACSSHYRIIISRQCDGSLTMIGGLYLQRNGSWVSNTHCPSGELHKKIPTVNTLPKKLLPTLYKIADSIQFHQFGADVIIDDAENFFVLELNDGMGISGPLLEQQQVPNRYVNSHVTRIEHHLRCQAAYGMLSSKGFYAPQPRPPLFSNKVTANVAYSRL